MAELYSRLLINMSPSPLPVNHESSSLPQDNASSPAGKKRKGGRDTRTGRKGSGRIAWGVEEGIVVCCNYEGEKNSREEEMTRKRENDEGRVGKERLEYDGDEMGLLGTRESYEEEGKMNEEHEGWTLENWPSKGEWMCEWLERRCGVELGNGYW